jgi:HSP20 family protein
VTVEDGILTVKGKREEVERESGEQGKVVRRERRVGSFRRSIRLPGEVDTESVKTRYEHGVLTLVLPKAEGGPVGIGAPAASGSSRRDAPLAAAARP